MPVRIQSVARALHILDTLAQHPKGLGIVEIAKQTGLNVSTTHHLVDTLCADNYVGRLDSGAYRLGHAVSRLYSAFLLTQQPEGRLREALDRLVSVTQETAYLAAWQEDDVVIQAIVEGSQQLRVSGLQVGFRGYTHARAAGKALLAYLDPEQLDDYLATHPLERRTPHTPTSKEALKTQLQQVVKQGFAVDQEEFAEGISCVAAPIFSADGRAVAALSISAPLGRMTSNFKSIVNAVTATAREASAILGFRQAAGRPRSSQRRRLKPSG